MKGRGVSASTVVRLGIPALLALLAAVAVACGQGGTAASPTSAPGGEATAGSAQGLSVTLYKAPG